MNFRASLIDFDIEDDRARGAVQREQVKQIAYINVDLVADRNNGRKADRPPRRPFDHSRRDGARLRDDRDIALLRHVSGEARIQFRGWHQHAEAIGTDQPQPRRLRCALGRLGQ